ncbi:MAG: transcription-repair coupling factor [Opitutae bacterium]|nr:transcription-repair coupling factor [Opitutae bacterium]|tara:strand:+ start:4732 stop:5031 length:300 start_codon:yes stop_codon:yes gene_type:complete
MLTHTVIFWLKKGLTQEDKDLFFEGAKTLSTIESVEQSYMGTPADTPKRPVVDDSYDCAISVCLGDLAAHDLYQADPIHLAFIEKCGHLWERVVIYDAS